MESDQNQKEKNDKYNLDDDTSSYSPEIEEESNNEEELEEQKNKSNENINLNNQEEEDHNKNSNINENKSNILYGKLMSIQKQLDLSQEKQKYLQYSQSIDNNNKNNKNNYYSMNKKSYKKNNINEYDDSNSNENDNDDDNYINNVKKNNINLNESEENENQNEYDNNNNNEDNNIYNKNNNNRHNRRFNPKDNNNNNIKQKESNLKEKGCELFIGNLNISTEKDDLMKLFRPYGNITDIRIHKNEDNKKCYAFVRYSTKEMANNALKLDSTSLNNRHIKVTKSNENATIFIGNIRKTWTQEELETKIRRIFHNINKIEFFTDPINPNKNRGFCFGIFNTRKLVIGLML